MRKLLRPELAPPGGWRFIDPDTNWKTKATSFRALVHGVRKYRATNALDPIHADIIEDWICHQPDVMEWKEVPTKRSIRQYISGARAAARILLEGDETFESRETAEARAAICVRCPNNVFDGKHSKAQKYTDYAVQLIVGRRKTSFDGALFSCSVCSCPLRSKVHIKQDIVYSSLTPEEKAKCPHGLPGIDGKPIYCWQITPVKINEPIK